MNKLVISCCISLCVLDVTLPAQAGQLSMTLSAANTHIVSREPVKLRVLITNDSDEPAHIMTVRQLTTSMRFMYLLVTPPGGTQERRRFVWERFYGAFLSSYRGELLSPHQSVLLFFYPNVTEDMDTHQTYVTFEAEGDYEVKAVYAIPGRLRLLDGAGQDIISNPVTITVEPPTPVEKEVLDACWANGGGWFSEGESSPSSGPDAALEQVISKYPDEPMTRFARLLLAKSLVTLNSQKTEWNARLSHARTILSELRANAPDFRKQEVAILYAICCQRLHRDKQAAAAFSEAAQEDPLLRTNYMFMRLALISEGSNADTWLRERAVEGMGQTQRNEK